MPDPLPWTPLSSEPGSVTLPLISALVLSHQPPAPTFFLGHVAEQGGLTESS